MDNTFTLNADFAKRVVIKPDEQQWVDSPIEGVERVMLDRIGGEAARATSLVRYAPNSHFPHHVHHGGEEFFVLAGTFADEAGCYPAGTYVRNPAGTAHSPSVKQSGATIFVKLHQFQSDDDQSVIIDTNQTPWHPGIVEGLSVISLHEHKAEHCALVKWAPNTQFSQHHHFGGEEVLVLEGTFYDEYGVYPEGSWYRAPHMSHHAPYTQDEGAVIYVKTGRLAIEDGF